MRSRLIFFCCVMMACTNSTTIPRGIIPPPKMEAVLYDVIRADEMADFSGIMDSTYRKFSRRTSLYDSIFHIHAITKEGFKSSLDFYQGRPDLLKIILDTLQKRADTTIPVVKPVKPL